MTKLTLLYAALMATLSYAAPAPAPLATRQISDEANDLLDGSPCKDLTLIFARGTTEPGNMGIIVGPPFADALISDLGADRVAVQGVDYPASIAGFLEGGDPTGSQTTASLVERAEAQCPDTKVLLSGYSQGGQLVHNAAKLLTASQSNMVAAVVIFGDPDDGQAVGSIPSNKVDIFCAVGDDICAGGDLILPPHLSYGADAPAAASFVVSITGL